jgi:hypothetical protein
VWALLENLPRSPGETGLLETEPGEDGQTNGILNTIDPPGGSVVLRGIEVPVDSTIGAAFVADVCRHVEDLMTAEALRTKYGLQDEVAWDQLGQNEPLQRAIASAKTRRIHDGSAAREAAQHLFLTTPAMLGGIISDTSMSPRHRIDAARELRACAAVGTEAEAVAEGERIRISINFGTAKIQMDAPMKTVKPEEPLTIEDDEEVECE